MDIPFLLWSTCVLYFVRFVSGKDKMVMEYQRVTEDFMKLTSNGDIHRYETISGTKDQIKELCMQSVTSDFFLHYPKIERSEKFTDIFVHKQIGFIEKHFAVNKEIIHVKRDLFTKTKKLITAEFDLIICHWNSNDPAGIRALANINDNGKYYIVSKSSELNQFLLVGRLEDAPECDVVKNNTDNIEEMFITSIQSSGKFHAKDICGINQFYHFAACATAAKALNIPLKTEFKKFIICTPKNPADICVRDSSIIYGTDGFENFGDHTLGILPCSVNTECNKPKFYVFNDQFEKNMLYVLKKKPPYVEPPVLYVVMRIKEVSSMEHAFDSLQKKSKK